ncbi:MAG: hypothetical protein ACYC27_05360 [Armatimonadota bacterium]
MRKRIITIAITALCVCIIMGAVNATPSTLVWIPSTDIQAAGIGHLGIDTYAPSEGDALLDYGITFGSGKFEYGIDYLSIDGGVTSPTRWNAKYLLKDESGNIPRLTAGVYDAGGSAASNIVYLLGSKTFPAARVTLGFGQGKESVLGEDNKMIFLGLDKSLTDKIWAAIDYQSGKSAFGALSAGVAYNFTKNTSVILGYDWYNDSNLSDTLTVQLDMNF